MNAHKGIANSCGIISLVLIIPFLVMSCGGGDDGGGAAADTAALGTLCGPRFDLTAGKSCPDGLCQSDVVQGTADDNIVGSYNFFDTDSMCTKACSTDSDCQGISFTTPNSVTVVSEIWACRSTGSGKYCAVSVAAPAGGGGICDGCGFPFCSGRCIGCPQC